MRSTYWRAIRSLGLWRSASWARWYAGNGSDAMFDESFGDADDQVLSDPDVLEAFKLWMREGARQGSIGYSDDWTAIELAWGFAVTDINQPVHVWWGESDEQVGRAHTDFLVASIPRATLVTFKGEGHLFPVRHWREMLDVLQ